MKRIKLIGKIAAAVLFAVCFIIVNTVYPAPKVVEAAMNEEVESDGIAYTAVECTEMSRELADKYYSADRAKLGDDVTYLVKMHVKNVSDDIKKMSLGGFAIARNDYANFSSLALFMDINDDDISLYLEKGEEKEFTLTFTIHQVNFTDKQWENIRDSKFKLVLSLHPQKTIINLS